MVANENHLVSSPRQGIEEDWHRLARQARQARQGRNAVGTIAVGLDLHSMCRKEFCG